MKNFNRREAIDYVYHFKQMNSAKFKETYGFPKKLAKRKKSNDHWMKTIHYDGEGQDCPTCFARMRPSALKLPTSVTVEHVIPICFGGRNVKTGTHPNCIPMCDACNKARNDVLIKYKDKISRMRVAKFLWDQVYLDAPVLDSEMEAYFHKQLAYHQAAPYRAKVSSPNRIATSTG